MAAEMSVLVAFPPAVRWLWGSRRTTTRSPSRCRSHGALPDFEEACKRANVPYTVSARPKMVHCYCMLPIFKEAKEDFAKIVDILKK